MLTHRLNYSWVSLNYLKELHIDYVCASILYVYPYYVHIHLSCGDIGFGAKQNLVSKLSML